MSYSVGIFIYDEVEVLDFAGPFEVFSTAGRVKRNITQSGESAFDVVTVAGMLKPVQARGGLTILPHTSLTNHPPFDILILPGGVFTPELEREDLLAWIRKTAETAQITASVCTGAFILARAGLLHGQTVTTHWEDIPALRAFPDLNVIGDKRWIDNGRILTSAGISAGMDMCLHIVARLEGEELALRTARQMEYTWYPSPDRGTAQ